MEDLPGVCILYRYLSIYLSIYLYLSIYIYIYYIYIFIVGTFVCICSCLNLRFRTLYKTTGLALTWEEQIKQILIWVGPGFSVIFSLNKRKLLQWVSQDFFFKYSLTIIKVLIVSLKKCYNLSHNLSPGSNSPFSQCSSLQCISSHCSQGSSSCKWSVLVFL